jgi:hypothetical protein
MQHYAWTTDGAEFQVNGQGPWGIVYVNPKTIRANRCDGGAMTSGRRNAAATDCGSQNRIAPIEMICRCEITSAKQRDGRVALTSLRAERSNSVVRVGLDCFACGSQ